MTKKHWIFLSPHFDDVALSCGGLVWDLACQGHHVEIWTLMGGFPPDADYSGFAQQNHLSWGMSGEASIRMRRAEDHAACQVLEVLPRHFDWPDAIYRRDPGTSDPIVMDNSELYSKKPEPRLVSEIRSILESEILGDARLVSPLGLGGHIDHQAVVKAVEQSELTNFYYADYPYILEALNFSAQEDTSLKKKSHHLGKEALSHWQEAILCYQSQLHTFWRDEQEARLALNNYQAGGGGRLWCV